MFAKIHIGDKMRIQKIIKQKNGKYKIVLEDQSSFTAYGDIILEKELLLTKEIDKDILDEIFEDSLFYDIYYKMIRKIKVRYRSEKEIQNLLEEEAISDEIKHKIIARLKQNNLLNDDHFIKCYINDRLHLHLDGPHLLFQNLKEYGIDEAKIIDEISKIDEKIFVEKVYKYIEKKVKSNHKYATSMLRQKILESLRQKGYDKDMILGVFESFSISDTYIIQKEYEKIFHKVSHKYEQKEWKFQIKQKLYGKGFSVEEINKVINLNLK